MINQIKFIAFGDLMGNRDFLSQLIRLDLSYYDFALFLGDIPDTKIFIKLSKIAAKKGINLGEDEESLAKRFEIKEILEEQEEQFREMGELLKNLAEKITFYTVWGNGDLVKMISKIFDYRSLRSLHLKIARLNGIKMIGYEGRPIYIFEKRNPDQRAFQEEVAEKQLAALFKQTGGSSVILATHSPPFMTLDQVETGARRYAMESYGQRAESGHIGSVAFKNITEKFKPILHIFSHIHESKGVVEKKDTLFVNVGSNGEDNDFAEVTVKGRNIRAKFVKI